ncbi:putative membrane protein [Hasllibacter halocynthiae]|uniref:Putative membrane protein n=1 Tax=Hasllibacter halocynthiae TaxID=595589 RepID=A0A2T0X685_9RHOB|nr:DUF2244 domain-containing protein [Hasllibacter halocynthiae]PRY94471.1 putative membrane protein [Hasllibacter halocynthiae]
MPYSWTEAGDRTRTLSLWPHRSLSRRGFALFMGITAALMALPLVVALGTFVFVAVGGFFALAFGGLWLAIGRSWRTGDLVEELRVGPEAIRLDRREPDGARRDWEANPHWVRCRLHPEGGPVENYLTLQGGPREVEIGAFLTPEERAALEGELSAALDDVRNG